MYLWLRCFPPPPLILTYMLKFQFKMSTKILSVSLLLLGSLLVCGVQVSDASASYTVIVTSENEEMGNAYDPTAYSWGPEKCDLYNRDFAPPRNEVARAAFAAATTVQGWAGLKYNASGDAPKYYVSGGRFKDCLYHGYPFGDMAPYWVGGVVTQTEGLSAGKTASSLFSHPGPLTPLFASQASAPTTMTALETV